MKTIIFKKRLRQKHLALRIKKKFSKNISLFFVEFRFSLEAAAFGRLFTKNKGGTSHGKRS
ncbi:hypothetical protein P7H00_10655 [Enterococcus pseudoavium]|uniref:Uncharacterized protein n=1 Tax=Enterococcus pseudoavium TaxID=44007 RepID=A0AAE4I1P6_9ENTE|nr:hypothetical protein [Enterococcus pseudoavium]MDT2737571.1 hypothetical protein [Enterococcus pseudoavium]